LPEEDRTSLTTHVLDAARGGPAAGLEVRLLSGNELVASGRTGPDGRLADLASSLEPGTYRLVFLTGDYFGSAGHLFAQVSLDLALTERRHYHVPLLLGPFSVTSYRGT
jgi:5-hydroxyisourate hydrolase